MATKSSFLVVLLALIALSVVWHFQAHFNTPHAEARIIQLVDRSAPAGELPSKDRISDLSVHAKAKEETAAEISRPHSHDRLVAILIVDTAQHVTEWDGAIPINIICAAASIQQQHLEQLKSSRPSLAKAVVHSVQPRQPNAPLHASDCTDSTVSGFAINEAEDVLLFIQGGHRISPVAVRWTEKSLPATPPGQAAAVALASAQGMPLASDASKDAKACFDAAGRRVGNGVCAAPMDATVLHSCTVSPGAMAVRASIWRDTQSSMRAAANGTQWSAFEQACERSQWRVQHLNLGAHLALAAPFAATEGDVATAVLQWWRPELDHISLDDVLDLSDAGKQSAEVKYDGGHSGTPQLLHVMHSMQRAQQLPFLGLTVSNEGFVNMTLAWMCQVSALPGVLERSVLVCTDTPCLDALRAHPASKRLGAIVGVDMLARLQTAYNELGMGVFAGNLGADLKYGTKVYHLFVLVRQLQLKDMVEGGVPFLLFETDAWWQRSAYEYLDKVLATNGSLELAVHAGVKYDAARLNITQAPFDMLLYVDDARFWNKQRIGIGVGFYLSLPLPGTVRVFDKWSSDVKSSMLASTKYGGTHVHETEQVMLQKLVAQKYKGFRPAFLPQKLFPNGEFYNKVATARAAKDKIAADEVVVVQFNYVIGAGTKATRAKRYNHWGLADDGQCMPLSQLPL